MEAHLITNPYKKCAAGSISANLRVRPHFSIDLHYGIIVFAGLFAITCYGSEQIEA